MNLSPFPHSLSISSSLSHSLSIFLHPRCNDAASCATLILCSSSFMSKKTYSRIAIVVLMYFHIIMILIRSNQFLDLDILLGHRLTQTSPLGFAHPDLPRIYDKYITYEHDRNHQFYIFGRQETCMSCKLKTKFSGLLWGKKTHIDWIH